MKKLVLLTIPLFTLVLACEPDHMSPPYGIVTLKLEHAVDDKPFHWDSLLFQNKAGEKYAVTKLEYYLSDIRFYKNGHLLYEADTTFYINAKQDHTFELFGIPGGAYDSIAYFIGIPSGKNQHGKMPATSENISMEWPDMMGGGYHFLKLEGHWKDSLQVYGFAMHLGTDAMLVNGDLKEHVLVHTAGTNNLTLTMNINHWFGDPYVYSFQTDGVYTMGDTTLMQKIRDNGKDVFYIK